jgi:hypothetical protein
MEPNPSFFFEKTLGATGQRLDTRFGLNRKQAEETSGRDFRHFVGRRTPALNPTEIQGSYPQNTGFTPFIPPAVPGIVIMGPMQGSRGLVPFKTH